MTRRAVRILLLAAVGLLALEAGLARSAAGPAASVKKSKKELLADLPAEERIWLTEYVAPIILPEEEKLFLELSEPHLRERFKREFWDRRERDGLKPPLGPGYEVRYGELRRLADEVYDGWREDAGRLVLRYGEPPNIHKVDCPHVFRDLEVWTYSETAVYPGKVRFLLFRTQEFVPRKLWNPGVSNKDLFLPNSCMQTFQSLLIDCPGHNSPTDRCDRQCPEDCDIYSLWQEILTRQGSAFGGEQERSKLLAPELVPLEGLDSLKGMSATAADPNAKPLSVTGPSATVPAPPAAAAPAAKRSKKELLEDLSAEERAWLTEYVAPIIQPEEEQLFLELSRPEHFLLFKSEFWNRREKDGLPFPMGPGYRGRYEELRRLADETYDGWRNDAGRMVLRYGEPASINTLNGCSHTFRDLEIWTYRQSAQAQSAVHHFFYRANPGAPRRLWTVGTSDGDVFESGSCRQNFPSLARDCTDRDKTDNCRKGDCKDLCDVFQVYDEIRSRQGSQSGGEGERGTLLQSAKISLEDLDSLRRRMLGTLSPPLPPPPVAQARLVKKSKKELLVELPAEERTWLTDYVAPIILPDEEKLFLELNEGYQREIFKKDFWQRREIDSLGAPYGEGFERRYEELRPRLDSEYDGWRHDAAQMVLHYGEPAEIRRPDSCNGSVFRDLEIWTVQHVSGTLRQTVHHIFYRSSPLVPRELWSVETTSLDRRAATGNLCVGNSSSPDNRLFQPGSCRKDFQSLLCDCSPQIGDPCLGPVCAEACDVYKVYQEILARQGSALGALTEKARLFKLPEVSTEGLETLRKRFATTADPNAKPLTVTGPTAKPPEPAPTPEPLHALTAEEIRDRIVHLEPKYRQFLDLAGPLLTEDSLQRFLQMTSKEKDRFMKEYWKRRS